MDLTSNCPENILWWMVYIQMLVSTKLNCMCTLPHECVIKRTNTTAVCSSVDFLTVSSKALVTVTVTIATLTNTGSR